MLGGRDLDYQVLHNGFLLASFQRQEPIASRHHMGSLGICDLLGSRSGKTSSIELPACCVGNVWTTRPIRKVVTLI